MTKKRVEFQVLFLEVFKIEGQYKDESNKKNNKSSTHKNGAKVTRLEKGVGKEG